VVAADAPRLPQTVAALVDGVAGETLVMALDLAGVAVSAGSACSSGKVAASHVLAAMGLGQDRARSAVRISFGWHTGASDIDDFLAIWRDVVGRMLDAEDAEAA
jgi:cysteine desulfurase